MYLIGLTGGIACGKSLASTIFAREGFHVIDCDQIAQDVTKKGRWGYRRIVSAFGSDILLPSGEIDRDALGQIIFSDPLKRKKLNHATHIPVGVELVKRIFFSWLQCKIQVVVDMPLLFESGCYKFVNLTIVVICSEESQVNRLQVRNKMPADLAEARVKSQMPSKEKVKLAHVVLENDSSIEDYEEKVSALAKQLKSKPHFWSLLLSPLGLITSYVTILLVRRLM